MRVLFREGTPPGELDVEMASAEKRYQVFISSTYKDLIAERQAVLSALLQLDAIPSGMELFPASDNDAWTLIQQIIDNCDYYLLILAGKYGSIGPDGLSYTEMEYDYAISTAKPVMAFVHGDPGSIAADFTEDSDEGKAKLNAFRKKVQDAKHTKMWTSADDLAGKVALSFPSTIKARPAVGWMRADTVASASAMAEIHDLRSQIDELKQRLEVARTTAPPGTEGLSQADDEEHVGVTYRIRLGGRAVRGRSMLGSYQSVPFQVALTWNEILSAIGPRLLDESTEKEMRTAVRSLAVASFWSQALNEEYLEQLREQGWDVSELLFEGVDVETIDDGSFNTIVVQLMALGLIEKGTRNRGVNDRSTYWVLTPYGRNEVVKLMAVRRDA